MTRLTDTYKQAIRAAIGAGCDFAVYQDSDDSAPVFVCDDGRRKTPLNKRVFFASPWPCESVIQIHDTVSAEEMAAMTVEQSATLPTPPTTSTGYTDYINDINALVDKLGVSGGKTVIARVVCGEHDADIADLADACFSANPGTYRALFNIKGHGCWLVASPELLLSVNGLCINTMALAGTRHPEEEGPWDDKNLREHKFVVDYIMSALDGLGLKAETGTTHNITTSTVSHLCTPIKAAYDGGMDPLSIALSLAPTPAVCGTPKSDALEHIAGIETFSRGMYGGFFGMKSAKGFKACVTLRCAQLSDDRFCVYAGGGITSQSVAQDEWAESAAKASSVLSLIQPVVILNHDQ